jgi:hypothetical protein
MCANNLRQSQTTGDAKASVKQFARLASSSGARGSSAAGGRLGLHSVDRYYHNRLLQWGGHIARMSMERLPRMILTGWVAHPRPTGCPQMTFGRTLNNALKQKGITTKF